MNNELIKWLLFNGFVLLMLILDLGVFHRKTHVVSIKEALLWTAFWILLSFIFCFGIYHFENKERALEFLTAYTIEKSLSVDNIFVFILIFSYFKVPPVYHHKVLFWGIIGALIMRFIFIFSGIALIHKFHWIIYVFAAFLLFTGIKMLFEKETHIEPSKNPVVKLFMRLFPVTNDFHEDNFFQRINGKLFMTPLFIVVLVVEFTDLIFAVDSIPAILAISTDEFIVYTSNVFAILGLRSLYFALSGMHAYFKYLKYGLAIILIFVGIKLGITDFYKIPTLLALSVIVGILLLAILISILVKKNEKK